MTIHKKYGTNFNTERIKLGLHPISEFHKVENTYWRDFYPEDPILRWKEILTNMEIANSTTYSNLNKNDRPFHKQKTVFYGTQVCFWQNFYGGEIDLFISPLDNKHHIELFIAYYSERLIPKNYFYANLDTVHNSELEFICGTHFIQEGLQVESSFPKGNITKEFADKLLTEWRIKK